MTTTAQKAIDILSGCPCGATEAALANNGIDRATLETLVSAGHLTRRDERHAMPAGLVVSRYLTA